MAPHGSLPVERPAKSVAGRDLRLDFFRGLSLLFIFVDHIPGNAFSYLTLANFVFNDAAEIFVFISGYTATIVFGGMALKSGPTFASLQVLSRCWTLYVAHIFLFVIFTAQIAYTAEKFANPMFIDEMKVAGFLQEPHVAIVKALTLQFQPEFMGILPLYIVLLLGFSVTLPLLPRHAVPVLAGSILLYAAVPILGLNLPTYPGGRWFHNPFAWQLLFVIGAVSASLVPTGRLGFLDSRWLFRAAIAFLVASVTVKLAMTAELVPPRAVEVLWLFLDKTDMGPLRLLNFLALALVVMHLVPREASLLRSRAARPVVLCGQHSLYIFCLGILLSYLAHLVLVEISHALLVEFLVSAAGILIMVAVAAFLNWTKSQARRIETDATGSARGPLPTQGGE